jgi:tetratricopeptide (TPR) repeat protein
MGKNILGLLLWLMIPAAVSCGGHQRELAQIERLLETNPSQADSLICTISLPKGKRAKALYAIISTQCDYKNYRDIPDDALIAHACNYYGTRKKSYHAAMAWYSRGCVLSLTDDDLGAIKSYLTARDLFPDTLNRYYVICEHNLGKQYLARHLYDEAMNMFELSFKNALTIRDDVTAAYSKYNIALLDLYERRFQKAETAFIQLASNQNLPELLRTETNLQLSKIQLHHHKDPGKALQYVNRYINELDYPSGAGYSIKADAFYAAESYDSAYHYYLLSLKCDTELSTESNDYSHLPELSLMLGHEDSTLYYMDRYKECLETQYERYNQSAITAIQMRHNLEKFDMLHKEEMKRYLILTSSIITVALLMFILLYLYQENRRRRRYEQLCDSLIRRRIENDIPEDSLEKALESSRSLFINSVGHTMLQDLSVVDRMPESSELSVIRHNTELYFEKPMAIMKATVPSLSQTEVMYSIYRYLGVNWRLCMELINRSQSYSGRLKQYILKKIPSEWEKLLFGA